MEEQENKISGLSKKLDDFSKANDALKAEIKAAGEAHKMEIEGIAAAHKEQIEKMTAERNDLVKAQAEVMALPRIRPVMIAPPVLQQVKPQNA